MRIVTFIYRPEYYKLDVWDDDDATPCLGQAEFIISKHRNGALDNVRLRFVQERAQFLDLENDFSSFEFQSSMNDDIQSTIDTSSSVADAFGTDDEDSSPTQPNNLDEDEPPF
jgi:replicative DNA helicase